MSDYTTNKFIEKQARERGPMAPLPKTNLTIGRIVRLCISFNTTTLKPICRAALINEVINEQEGKIGLTVFITLADSKTFPNCKSGVAYLPLATPYNKDNPTTGTWLWPNDPILEGK